MAYAGGCTSSSLPHNSVITGHCKLEHRRAKARRWPPPTKSMAGYPQQFRLRVHTTWLSQPLLPRRCHSLVFFFTVFVAASNFQLERRSILLSAGDPIMYHFTTPKPSFNDAFNCGGSDTSGAVCFSDVTQLLSRLHLIVLSLISRAQGLFLRAIDREDITIPSPGIFIPKRSSQTTHQNKRFCLEQPRS